MREAKRARETALLADLLPHPVLLIAIILFVLGLVLGSVGAACYNDTLVGTTCSYTASVWLLSVGWPLAGILDLRPVPLRLSALFSLSVHNALLLTLLLLTLLLCCYWSSSSS